MVILRSQNTITDFFDDFRPGHVHVTLSMPLPDPSRDTKTVLIFGSWTPAGISYSLSLVMPVGPTDKAMSVNCHQVILSNIDISFCNPMCVGSTPALLGGILTFIPLSSLFELFKIT